MKIVRRNYYRPGIYLITRHWIEPMRWFNRIFTAQCLPFECAIMEESFGRDINRERDFVITKVGPDSFEMELQPRREKD